MEEVNIQQRAIIRFLTLEGVTTKQILERLQKVYCEEALSSDQVEYWATETNDAWRSRTKLAMAALLRNTDVMADVLAFLPRRGIALQLARVNRQFSALCNCSCSQPEKEEAVPTPSAFENVEQRKRNQGLRSHPSTNRRRCWSCTTIYCLQVVRQLDADYFVTLECKGITNLCDIDTSFIVQLHRGW